MDAVRHFSPKLLKKAQLQGGDRRRGTHRRWVQAY
jgi:hypothetical protein